MVAEKGHHKNNHIVYCVRNDISKWTKNHLCRGPELIILEPQHTRLGPWLMSGHRLLIWGPKFLRWEYGRDTEMNLSGPQLIMSGPLLVMSGPRDNYVGAPTYCTYHAMYVHVHMFVIHCALFCMWSCVDIGKTCSHWLSNKMFEFEFEFEYYVGAPYLLFWGSEMIMLGPDLSSGDPDLLCPGPEIIMWEPRFVEALLVISGPEIIIWGPWLIMWGVKIIMFGPGFIMLGLLLIMLGPQILCDIASKRSIFFKSQ